MRWVTVVTALLFLSACDGDGAAPSSEPSVPVASEAPSPTAALSPTPTDDCANRTSVLEEDPSEQVLAGPIDPADDNDDRAWIVVDAEGEQGCRAWLVVDTAAGIGGLAIDRSDAPTGGGLPRLAGLAAIDERPGAEVVVNMLAGASTEFVAVFSMGGGGLEQLTIAGDDAYGDLFPTGGSVGHLEASDCPTGTTASVVVSLAVPLGRRYEVTRTFYVTRDGMLRRDRIEREVIRDPQDLESYQEFLGSPFGTCAPAA